MLDESTNNLKNQKNVTNEFSALGRVATGDVGTKSSLGSLKLRNLNHLIFDQFSIISIRNKFELLFSLVSSNISFSCL